MRLLKLECLLFAQRNDVSFMLETLKELLHFSFCKRAFIGVRVDVFKEANQMMELSALDELFCTQNVQLEEVKSTAVE